MSSKRGEYKALFRVTKHDTLHSKIEVYPEEGDHFCHCITHDEVSGGVRTLKRVSKLRKTPWTWCSGCATMVVRRLERERLIEEGREWKHVKID